MKEQLIAWMADTSIAHFMADWQWAWPWAEVIHFIGMSMLFGAVIVMDLRLLGFFRKQLSLHAAHALTKWAVIGFVLNLITGVAFFMKDAERYWPNQAFWFKVNCILLAGVNFLVFWWIVRKRVARLPDDGDPGLLAKSVGLSSVALWTLVIFAGRLMPLYGEG
jgi:hypothetical protein